MHCRNLFKKMRSIAISVSCVTLQSSMSMSASATGAQNAPNVERSMVKGNNLGTDDVLALEQEILTAPSSRLYELEHRIAQSMQIQTASHVSHYLMSSLFLRMYLMDPTDTTLLRQSALMAAQTYELAPKSDLGIVALANILEVSGEVEKGLSLLHEAEKKDIERTWRFSFAQAKLMTGEESSKDVMHLLESTLADPNALRAVVAPYVLVAILSNSKSADLHDEITKWNTRFPCTEFGFALANVLVRDNKPREAMALLKSISEREPNRFEPVAMQIELAISELNDFELAKQLLDKVDLKSIPPHLAAEMKMSKTLIAIQSSKEKFDVSLALEAVKSAENAELALLKIVDQLQKKKKRSIAIEFLRSAQLEVPGTAIAYGLYGEILLSDLKRHQDAVFAFSDAIVLDQENSRYFNGRGLAYHADRQFDRALADFQSAARIDPSDGSARYNLACILALKGRSKEALEALASAVELDETLLIHARKDKDFASLRGTREFESVLENGDGSVFAH